MIRHIMILIMDSVGIGEQPDAAKYESRGANTLHHAATAHPRFSIPNLQKLGIGNIEGVTDIVPSKNPLAHYGRMREITSGNDTFAGVWEMAGVIFEKRFSSFSPKMPANLVRQIQAHIEIGTLCNTYISGMKVLDQYADQHFHTGRPILYTSDDGVILIAAHEQVILPQKLKEITSRLATFFIGKNVSRIIARPFKGEKGAFVRTKNRADFVVPFDISVEHLFTRIKESGTPLTVTEHLASLIGKDYPSRVIPGIKDSAGIMDSAYRLIRRKVKGISMFVVPDFDMSGHRKDPQRYAHDLINFDEMLGKLMGLMTGDDILFIVADHGCDPTLPIRGHTREYVPLLVYSPNSSKGVSLGTRGSFSDLGQTICRLINTPRITYGKSFANLIT